MADYAYITATGVIVPDTSDLLTQVENEFREAFGADLVTTPDTPQGVLIVAETLARDAVVRNNAALANQINPNLSGGVFLDALWALTGGQRVKASKTVVLGVQLAGVPGSVIPELSQARVGADGPIFELTSTVQLDDTGNAVATFQALEAGPVAAPVAGLDRIVSGVLGWETITNPVAGVQGRAQESDQSARRRRRETLALQSTAMSEAIVSELFDTEGVTSVLYRENITDAVLTIDGVDLSPHSILAVVAGGADGDVAASLLRKKSGGCDWNGATVVNVTDPVSGQIYPVKFQRPTEVPIFVEVTVRMSAQAVLADPELVVRTALIAYAQGLTEDEEGWTIGTDASPFELAPPINAVAPGLFVTLVRVGLSAMALGTATIPIAIDEQAQMIEGNISVIVL